MDGLHDIGGKQGFGPIKVSENDPGFSTDWEGRLYALSQTTGPRDGNIDWFRHTVELLEPLVYLQSPYFQKWYMTLMTGMIQSGEISLNEALSGKAAYPMPPATTKSTQEVLNKIRAANKSFACGTDVPAAFEVGDNVRTKSRTNTGHTRLPAYARDRDGVILAHHGAHVFPDSSAEGRTEGQHLYSVAFSASELWGPEANLNDRMVLDLWESYFVQA